MFEFLDLLTSHIREFKSHLLSTLAYVFDADLGIQATLYSIIYSDGAGVSPTLV